MRFSLAIGASLLMHGALIALPSGHFSFSEFRLSADPTAGSRVSGGPAPITVKLGPQSIRPVTATRNRGGSAGGVVASAPALDAHATQIPAHANYKGEEEAFGLPVPIPFGLSSPQEYLPSRELSEHPQMITDVPGLPDDPVALPGAGILVINLWINEYGLVDRSSVVSSQLDAKTEQAVVAQFQRMRFSPAQRDGRAVKSRMKIQVEVTPPSATATETSAAGN
jgi:TonB family protein